MEVTDEELNDEDTDKNNQEYEERCCQRYIFMQRIIPLAPLEATNEVVHTEDTDEKNKIRGKVLCCQRYLYLEGGQTRRK